METKRPRQFDGKVPSCHPINTAVLAIYLLWRGNRSRFGKWYLMNQKEWCKFEPFFGPKMGTAEYGQNGCLFKAQDSQNPDMCVIYLCTLPFWIWSVPKVDPAHRVQWAGLSFLLWRAVTLGLGMLYTDLKLTIHRFQICNQKACNLSGRGVNRSKRFRSRQMAPLRQSMMQSTKIYCSLVHCRIDAEVGQHYSNRLEKVAYCSA